MKTIITIDGNFFIKIDYYTALNLMSKFKNSFDNNMKNNITKLMYFYEKFENKLNDIREIFSCMFEISLGGCVEIFRNKNKRGCKISTHNISTR